MVDWHLLYYKSRDQIIAITFFSKILHYVGELFMQFKERVTDLVLRHARFSLLLSGEPGTVV
jgi:hypothetical protein